MCGRHFFVTYENSSAWLASEQRWKPTKACCVGWATYSTLGGEGAVSVDHASIEGSPACFQLGLPNWQMLVIKVFMGINIMCGPDFRPFTYGHGVVHICLFRKGTCCCEECSWKGQQGKLEQSIDTPQKYSPQVFWWPQNCTYWVGSCVT
jgi:hypothetical protein